MTDFLTFKKFISTDVLIFFYYLFALILPVFVFYMKNRLLKSRIFQLFFPNLKKNTFGQLNKKEKYLLIFCLILCFILFEVFLRMFFEFLIGYIQIRNALAG